MKKIPNGSTVAEEAKFTKDGNVYYLTDFDSILKGFDANLLGLPLRKSNKYAK